MKKKIIYAMMLALFGVASMHAGNVVKSPDGRLMADFIFAGGRVYYQVFYNGNIYVEPSPLGVVTNIGDYTADLQVQEVTTREVRESYELRNIKQSHVDYRANEMTVSLAQQGQHVMDITFRVSNRDVAFRYTLHPKKETRCCIVQSEATTFKLPKTTTSFLAPQAKPMTGFARTAPSYETRYGINEPVGKNGWGNGYTFPCLFRETEGWLLISETGTDGGYVGCRLLGEPVSQYKIGFPQQAENNGYGPTTVQMALPGSTPWRTITVGPMSNIIETTVPWDLVEPKYKASRNYEYGKGSWSWIIGMDGSCNFDEQKRYIDFSAAMGYRSVLVDALWDKQIGYDRIAELARYGKTKGVGLYLWYNSNGAWNDAPQSPKGIMDNTARRRQDMKWMKENGILGIKVDFFGGDKQTTMKLYEDILTDANEYGLLVIFHGCTLPRGWERMYPNYAASEAVLASENLHFGQGFCDNEARDCGTMYPFTRNVVGSMDFGGSALNKFYNADNRRGTQRKTSDVYALATAVLFQSAVQHFALAPNNLEDAPDWAIDFLKKVPTTWDEVRFIDGYPGKYIVLARRSGTKWYVAGVCSPDAVVRDRNGVAEPLKLTLELPVSMFDGYAKLYQNDKVTAVKASKKIKVEMPANGGFVMTQYE